MALHHRAVTPGALAGPIDREALEEVPMTVQLDDFKAQQRSVWETGDYEPLSERIADVGENVVAHAATAFMPPPPDYASPPILWSNPEYVRERFAGVARDFEFESHVNRIE
jgi:hypothetical protein